MSMLSDILEWSEGRCMWWRDALRRLFQRAGSTPEDIEELALICKESHGLRDQERPAPAARPLSAYHVPQAAGVVADVTLLELSDVQDVNALAPSAQLRFEASGLTVIYGDNASGKTGYVRVLKRLCRARGAPERVYPNVYSSAATGTPKATLRFRVGQTERAVSWEEGQIGPAELGAVSVFDARSATSYVQEQTDVAYRPFGLDLLDRLAVVCGDVKRVLETEKGGITARRMDLGPLVDDTSVGKLLASLSAETPVPEVEKVATLSEEDRAHLDELGRRVTQLRGSDPARRAKELGAKAARYEELGGHVALVEEVLAEPSVGALRTASCEAASAAEAASLAAKALFEGEPLTGVGGDAWRAVWESARRYSEIDAYRGVPFPVVSEAARCVLCQQELTWDAKGRLQRFEEFIRGDLERKAAEARGRVAALRRRFDEHRIDPLAKHLREELEVDDPQCAQAVSAFLTRAAARTAALVKALEDGNWAGVPRLAESPHRALARLAERIGSEAKALLSERVSEEAQRLECEFAELQARQRLAPNKERVLAEVERQQQLAKLEECLAECNTQSISLLSTKLTQERVSNVLRDRLQLELRRCGATHIQVEFESVGSRRGAMYHRIRLKGSSDVPVGAIASEGEHTCLALAGLLTELATASHRSAIVLDDPVSSLDHCWREQVARRLAIEARSRQVIVFTHDLVFLMYLREQCNNASVLCTERSLVKTHKGFGECSDGPPWDAMNVKQRIGQLRVRCQEAGKVFRDQEAPAYSAYAAYVYGLLRGTWERAVEEVVLNRTVERFKRAIETKRLQKVVRLTQQHYETVEKAVTKCSKFVTGHDQPPAINKPLPPPDELLDDVNELDQFVRDLRKRYR